MDTLRGIQKGDSKVNRSYIKAMNGGGSFITIKTE